MGAFVFLHFSWASIPAIIVLSVFLATRINALNVQVHEGSHHLLSNSRVLSDWMTNWLAGYWIFYDVDSYRATHIRHHLALNGKDDPDAPFYTESIDRKSILHHFLRDFFGITAFSRLLVYQTPKNKIRSRIKHSAAKITLNLLLLLGWTSVLGFSMGVTAYFVFWIVPFFSIFPMIVRFRIMVEHYATERMEKDHKYTFVARTTECESLERYLIGAQMEFHFEHHIFPELAFYYQRALHEELKQKRFFDGLQSLPVCFCIAPGYFKFWRSLLKLLKKESRHEVAVQRAS